MKNAPCAKFTMRMIPKFSVRPTPRKNTNAACDRALRHWVMRKPRKSISVQRDHGIAPSREGRGRIGWAARSAIEGHLPAGWGDFVAWIGRKDLRHGSLEALLLHDLHHVAALHGLVVAGADGDVALDGIHSHCLERGA